MAPIMFERDVNLTHDISAARETIIAKQPAMTSGHCINGPHRHVDDEFIREAIAKSNPNALRLALYQVTGDPDLAKMRTRRHAVRGGAMYAHVLEESEIPALHEKAFAYLSQPDSQRAVPPPPSPAEARKMMDIWGDEPINDADFQFNYEELAYDEFPRTTQWTTKKPSAEKINAFKIIVIGCGISGVACAVQFKNLGLNFQVLERQHDIGGTWLLNTYPDARVDTSSFLYQFKFVKNYPWTEFYASAGDTRAYLAHVVQQHGVRDHFLFNREVTRAVWSEERKEWQLTIKHAGGAEEVMTCNAIVSGSGLFATPNSKPDIPGINDFKRPIFHTATWDHDVDYKNKRVALLGTGSTGTQLAPAVARVAKSLTVYQRTPSWIMNLDGYRNPIDQYSRWIFDNMPYYWNWYCYGAHTGGINERNDKVKAALTDYIQSKVEGQPGLLQKLLPQHAPLVRRLVVDNGFYDMLRQDHVELVTEKIDRFTEAGIATADRKLREFDVVVLGTGFKVAEYFWPCEYVGRDGITLEDLWNKDGARSYLGLSMPGFPNMFSFYGPNHQPRSGGFYSWAEVWARYTADCIIHLLENNKQIIDVRKDVYDTYNEALDKKAATLLWEQPGSGYYVNKFGRSGVNLPWPTSEYHRMVSKPNFEDYDIR
ncbi:hypothetical protein BST61_g9610 [Cercospora zeina]